MIESRFTAIGTALVVGLAFLIPSAPAQDSERGSSSETERVIYSSTLWKKGSYSIEGAYRVLEREDRSRVLRLSRSFKTKAGPDLKVVLSPLAHERVTKRNALQGGLVLGVLGSERGPQEFSIPAGTDLSGYRSVVIHCEQFSVLWGAAPLARGEVLYAGGEWTRKTRRTAGRYEIVAREGEHFIRFSSDFKTAKAPEPLRVVLSTHTRRSAKSSNAEEGGLKIAELASESGSQEIKLAGGIDYGRYRTLLLNCKRYTKLWSVADLEHVAR